MAACSSNTATTAVSPQEATSTEEATATEQVTPTEEVTEAPIAETPISEVTEEAEIVDYIPSEAYSLAISMSLEDTLPENTPPAPEGQRWVVIVASFTNTSGETITITAESLTLITSDGMSYAPEAPDDATMPALIGNVVEVDQTARGLIRFAIPVSSTPAALQWCADEACTQQVRTPVPQL